MPSWNPNLAALRLSISSLLDNPSLLLPNLTIPTFLDLPDDLSSRLPTTSPRIRALVLDKDNTLTPPESTTIPPAYLAHLAALRISPTSPFNMRANPGGVLLVSNTVGASPKYEAQKRAVETKLAELGIDVLDSTATATTGEEESTKTKAKKPLNYPHILAHLRQRGVVGSPSEIAVVGDRLATDVLMAGYMGAWSVWVRDGVRTAEDGREGVDQRGIPARFEAVLEKWLRGRGYQARIPTDAGSTRQS